MAVKQSRAVELAKLAAEAARAEVLESEAPLAPIPTQGWELKTLQGFRLQPAMQQAVQQVANHLAHALRHEGLDVVVPPAPMHDVAQMAQSAVKTENSATEPAHTVRVQEGHGGRVVRGYSTPAVLGLFASQQQRNGIVVDGQI